MFHERAIIGGTIGTIEKNSKFERAVEIVRYYAVLVITVASFHQSDHFISRACCRITSTIADISNRIPPIPGKLVAPSLLASFSRNLRARDASTRQFDPATIPQIIGFLIGAYTRHAAYYPCSISMNICRTCTPRLPREKTFRTRKLWTYPIRK